VTAPVNWPVSNTAKPITPPMIPIIKLPFTVEWEFIHQHRTADFMLTKTLRQMVKDGANSEDIIAYSMDKNLPADEIILNKLTEEVLSNPPVQEYLTVSNALQ